MKRERIYESIISLTLFAVFLLFFLNRNLVEISDIKPHYEFAFSLPKVFEMGIEQFGKEVQHAHIISYPGWHIVFLVFFNLFRYINEYFQFTWNIETISLWAQAVENAILLLLTFQIVLICYKRFFGLFTKKAMLLSVMLMFVGPLYIPEVNMKYYLGQFIANPWHNPTTFIVRPLAVISFFLFCYIYKQREIEGEQWRGKKRENQLFALLAISLFISAWMKPNFYQVFVPAVFLFCVGDVCRTRFSSFWFCFKAGLAVLPVCILALIQYIASFGSTSNGIVWAPFRIWECFTDNEMGSFLISMAFPLLVIVFCAKRFLKDPAGLLSLLLSISAIGQFICFSLEEGGEKGDFLWGVYLATFLLFMVCGKYLFDLKKNRVKFVITGAVGFMHFLYGMRYFISVYLLNTFYI